MGGMVEGKAAAPSTSGKMALSVDALEEGKKLAPGWDIYALEAKFLEWANSLGEPLRLPVDKAFIGWVKSFTKGKRP